MDLKTLKDIPSSFILAKRSLMICLIVCIISIASSMIWAFMVSVSFRDRAFVLSKDGAAAFATGVNINEIDTYRRPEIVSHVRRFHELFWNIDQFNYEKKSNKSFYLIGDSGKQIYLSLKAQGHYAKIESQNLVQKLEIDSVQVDDQVIPYKAMVYGKLIVNRTDQKSRTLNSFKSFFDVYNVSRTENNPHGLLIENYIPRFKEIKE